MSVSNSNDTRAVDRVAILDDYQNVALKTVDWSKVTSRVSVDVYTDTSDDLDTLIHRLQPYSVICAMRERTKFSADVLDRLPNLKFIATTGFVNRGIDLDHAKSKGIVVSGTGGSGNSTLEHIWALILASTRYIAQDDANVKSSKKQWQSYVPLGLSGRVLGLVGVGRLGTATGKIAKAFNMRVIGWSPHLTPERAEAAGVEFIATLEELMKLCDVVSIHMVLDESTRNLINATHFRLMKPSAFFINTSRGPIANESALLDVLRERKISGAGLDVYDVEPLPLDHPFRGLDNVTLTPHTGYVSDDNYKTFWSQTVENVSAYLDGEPKRVINA